MTIMDAKAEYLPLLTGGGHTAVIVTVAVRGYAGDWAAYRAVHVAPTYHEEQAARTAAHGDKLSEREARLAFPHRLEVYRR